MNKEEILGMAKFIAIPWFATGYSSELDKIPNLVRIRIPEGNYNSYPLYQLPEPEHHYLPEFHVKILMPKLAEMFGFKFDLNDFIKKPRFILGQDFTHYIPKENYNLELTCDGKSIIVRSDKMSTIDSTKRLGRAYLKFFRYCHNCCQIVNPNSNTNKSLLVSCDSHMVYSMPLLSHYFRKVVFLDVRKGSGKYLYENDTFTDALIAIGQYPISKYLISNFR